MPPTVVFSHPPIGTVGLTEPQAIAQFGADRIVTKQSRFSSMGYAMNGGDGYGEGTQKAKPGHSTFFQFCSSFPLVVIAGLAGEACV